MRGADRVSGALEDPRAEGVQLRERGGVREGEREGRERERGLRELRVVRGEEVERPDVRRGRVDRVVCEAVMTFRSALGILDGARSTEHPNANSPSPISSVTTAPFSSKLFLKPSTISPTILAFSRPSSSSV